MGAIIALVVGVPFVIFWITSAAKMGAPGFMVFFGVAFFVILVIQIVKGFYNATSKDRISEIDITSDKEESDPFSRLVRKDSGIETHGSDSMEAVGANAFCQFCGSKVGNDFKFCPKCGKPLS